MMFSCLLFVLELKILIYLPVSYYWLFVTVKMNLYNFIPSTTLKVNVEHTLECGQIHCGKNYTHTEAGSQEFRLWSTSKLLDELP